MKNLTRQNPRQLIVAQELINKVKSKCCGIKVNCNFMVTYFDACEILEMLSEASVKVFLDGGWGVDALIGRETRIHND
ncbi:MAG: hypothetical protein PUC34_07985, partial [Paludibacteraceae bacterium]|nr:hypothetical protein [Paludibacteraceae bacterium]